MTTHGNKGADGAGTGQHTDMNRGVVFGRGADLGSARRVDRLAYLSSTEWSISAAAEGRGGLLLEIVSGFVEQRRKYDRDKSTGRGCGGKLVACTFAATP